MANPSSSLLLLAAFVSLALGTLSQISSPVAHDHQVADADKFNKYRGRAADLDKDGDIQHEGPVPGSSRCGRHRLDLAWMSEATSSVYATPLITDLHADGRRDIVVPSFVHYLEVLEGPNGGQAVGWPAFHASSVHASPLMYDIDFDGVRDVLLATYDGQVMFFKDTGDKLLEGIQVNRLRVRRDWYVGLDPNDPFDHTHPDVGDGEAAAQVGGRRAGRSGGGNGGNGGGGGGRKTTTAAPVTGAVLGATGIGGGNGGMTERVRKFVRQMTEYRKKYGDMAADKLMAEARAANTIFYDAVQAALRNEDGWDFEAAANATAANTTAAG